MRRALAVGLIAGTGMALVIYVINVAVFLIRG